MSNLPPVKLAFVLDGVVQDVLHTDDRLGAIFLSQPTIVDVTDLMAEMAKETENATIVNWTFDGETFNPPAQPVEKE